MLVGQKKKNCFVFSFKVGQFDLERLQRQHGLPRATASPQEQHLLRVLNWNRKISIIGKLSEK